jgi:hypothetical protein
MAKQYDVPLRLVTPRMKGSAVKDAQWLLKGNNRFSGLAPYKDGKIDSEYGPLTEQATRRAKFWLGYPTQGIDGAFGQTLYEYLLPRSTNKWRPLPDAYRKRRDARVAQAAKEANPGARALALAKKEIGYHESPPGSNSNKFGIEYGWNRVAWCAIFESIMFKHSGTPKFRYASVEMIYLDATANRNGLYIVRTPRPGDVVGYRLHGDEFAHTAFFVNQINNKEILDLGGNTSVSNFSNGGEVGEQRRSTSLIHFYARIQ